MSFLWFANLQVLDSLDAVVDVGGVYDPARDRFDHHQKGFHEVFGHGFTTKLSSAGIVYKVRLPQNKIISQKTRKTRIYVVWVLRLNFGTYLFIYYCIYS